MPSSRHCLRVALGVGALLAVQCNLFAGPPLHRRIDEVVGVGKSNIEEKSAPLCSDAEFVRRLSLDLHGVIPSADQVREFLDDPSSQKRKQEIERVLKHPRYARHMAGVFDRMLMERRADLHVPTPEWREYLRTSLAADKPWSQLVEEILTADGADEKTRPAAKFCLDREAEAHTVTRDVGRMFLGVDLQCAQCHDHPNVGSYFQEHYYGIFSFLSQVGLYAVNGKTYLGEKGDLAEVSFTSVFTKTKGKTGPKLPGKKIPTEAALVGPQDYWVAPANGARPIPKRSRRTQLARELTSSSNRAFARNAANRLWAVMMGRGLVEPLDMHHVDNPPTHAPLLDLLTDAIVAMNFDVRGFLREIALSTTYQRSSELPEGVDDASAAPLGVAQLKPLSVEPLAWSLLRATGRYDVELANLQAAVRLKDPKFGLVSCGDEAWKDRAIAAHLSSDVAPLENSFAGARGQAEGPFSATVEQALFLRNGAVVRSWIARRPGNLVDRLAQASSQSQLAEEMYLAVLSRRPTPEERSDLSLRMNLHYRDPVAEIERSVWALLSSAEFRFNH